MGHLWTKPPGAAALEEVDQRPQQRLYLRPEPHGPRALRAVLRGGLGPRVPLLSRRSRQKSSIAATTRGIKPTALATISGGGTQPSTRSGSASGKAMSSGVNSVRPSLCWSSGSHARRRILTAWKKPFAQDEATGSPVGLVARIGRIPADLATGRQGSRCTGS